MMEGALQSVKASLTALASQLRSWIKDQIDSTTANINQVRESMTEALLLWERFSQRIERIEKGLLKISSDVQLGTEKNVEKSSESFQVDEHEFPDSKFQDMAKDGAVTRVAAVPEAEVVGGKENKF